MKTEDILKTVFFRQRYIHNNRDFRVLLKHKSKIAGDSSVFKFILRGVGGRYSLRRVFRVKPPFSFMQFLWCNFEGILCLSSQYISGDIISTSSSFFERATELSNLSIDTAQNFY